MSRDYLEHIVEQRSPAWHQLRSGRVNGSTAKDVLAKITKGEAAARRDLRVQLALETVLGTSCEDSTYVNSDMQRGIDLEAEEQKLAKAQATPVAAPRQSADTKPAKPAKTKPAKKGKKS